MNCEIHLNRSPMATVLSTEVTNIFSPQEGIAQTVVFTVGDSLLFFFVWISSFPESFIEESHLSPLHVFSSIAKDQLIIYVWDYF